MKKKVKNLWKAPEEKYVTNYLYIITPLEHKDMQKLYECFQGSGYKRTICQKGDDFYVKVETEKPATNMKELLEPVQIKSIKAYEYVNGWEGFESEKIDRKKRNLLFARLVDIRKKSNTIWKFIFLLAIIGCGALGYYSYTTKDYTYGIVASLVLFLGIVSRIIGPKINMYRPQRKEAREKWMTCTLDVVATDMIVHRDDKEDLIENVYMLGKDKKCIKYIFSGEDVKIGDKAIIFFKKDITAPIAEDVYFDEGIQVSSYNGQYFVIPTNYKISRMCQKLIDKYEASLNKDEMDKVDPDELKEEKKLEEKAVQ